MYHQITLNARGTLLVLDRPIVMGILNVSPDSFYPGSRKPDKDSALSAAEKMLSEGARIIDIGAVSTRPGATPVSFQEEYERLMPVIEAAAAEFPEALFSVDTTSPKIALEAIQRGAHLINDISGGRDPGIWAVAAHLQAPYILMHMQGVPETMQDDPKYQDVTSEVMRFFIARIRELRNTGVKDVILDPGFGFGKSVDHNYQLLKNLGVFKILELPVLAGISRKSMICKVLKINPENALNGSTALHMLALQNGARILRVHDVKEAAEAITLWQRYHDVS